MGTDDAWLPTVLDGDTGENWSEQMIEIFNESVSNEPLDLQ